jgi:4-amino-4-deoxy-L-arabinose transferase-like glycosyltransferase
LALFLRFWRLDSLPPGLHHDEAYNGLDALSILSGETFPIYHEGWELYAQDVHAAGPVYQSRIPVFFEGNYGREPLTVYLMAAPIALLGATPLAIRVVPAAAGVLAVLATYLAASALTQSRVQTTNNSSSTANGAFSTLTPLLAAFIMAVLYPAITFSRFGDRAMLFVPVEALVVYCFWRGIQAAEGRKKPDTPTVESLALPLGDFAPKWFLAAGILLGIGFYIYAAARFLPLLFLGFVLLWFWRDRQALRRQWANMALMAFAAAVVLVPIFIYFFYHPYFIIFRSRFVANRGEGTFPGKPWLTWSFNVGRVARGLLWEGDTNILHNLPGRPYLDPIQFVLALSGVISMGARRFSRRDVFLLMWLLVMLLPGILSGDAPHFGRLIGASSPLAILIAIGAVWLGQLVVNRLSPDNPRAVQLAGVGLMALLLVSAGLATVDYMWRYANFPDLQAAFDDSDWQLGQYAAELPEDATIYLTPNQEEMATIYFALGGQRERLRSFHSPGESLMPVGHQEQSTYYLIRPRAEAVLRQLEAYFPGGEIDTSNSGFSAFWLPEGTRRLGLNSPVDINWGGAVALHDWGAEQSGDHLYLSLAWQPQVQLARDYTVYVHILKMDGTLVAQLDRPPDGYPTSDWKPGEIIQDRYDIVLPPELEAGTYLVQSGFYYLPSQERLGEPTILGEVELE